MAAVCSALHGIGGVGCEVVLWPQGRRFVHGIQDSLIETLGCWLQSSAYTLHVHTPRDVLQGVGTWQDVFVLNMVGQ